MSYFWVASRIVGARMPEPNLGAQAAVTSHCLEEAPRRKFAESHIKTHTMNTEPRNGSPPTLMDAHHVHQRLHQKPRQASTANSPRAAEVMQK